MGAIWLDHPRYVELVRSCGSISSNQVNRVFSGQVELSTSTVHRVIASALLDFAANSSSFSIEDTTLVFLYLWLARRLQLTRSHVLLAVRSLSGGVPNGTSEIHAQDDL